MAEYVETSSHLQSRKTLSEHHPALQNLVADRLTIVPIQDLRCTKVPKRGQRLRESPREWNLTEATSLQAPQPPMLVPVLHTELLIDLVRASDRGTGEQKVTERAVAEEM
ncbi:MAG: hypothetical protein ACREJ4_04090 [Candidatus Methylomirabilaceae bacterium]